MVSKSDDTSHGKVLTHEAELNHCLSFNFFAIYISKSVLDFWHQMYALKMNPSFAKITKIDAILSTPRLAFPFK